MFSYDFCKNFQSSYFQEHLGAVGSGGISYKTKRENKWSHGQLYLIRGSYTGVLL